MATQCETNFPRSLTNLLTYYYMKDFMRLICYFFQKASVEDVNNKNVRGMQEIRCTHGLGALELSNSKKLSFYFHVIGYVVIAIKRS